MKPGTMKSSMAVRIVLLVLMFIASGTYAQVMTSEIKMYKSVGIDGCSDFHCLKCGDRKMCSSGASCIMPNCGHKHGAVMCHGGILFYLRVAQGFTDDSGKPSCTARADHVAGKLNEFMAMMANNENSYFTVLDQNRNEVRNYNQIPAIFFSMMDGDRSIKLVSVTNGDLNGYKYRARLEDLKDMAMPADKLTKKLVAQWWAYTLKDHLTMMVLNEKPYLTTYTHCGRVLLTMWEKARKLVPSPDPIPLSTWSQVVDGLSSRERSDLYLAAKIVPINFDPNRR